MVVLQLYRLGFNYGCLKIQRLADVEDVDRLLKLLRVKGWFYVCVCCRRAEKDGLFSSEPFRMDFPLCPRILC